MNETDKAKPTAVDCPKCGLTNTGYFCACGKDLRQFFGVKPASKPPHESRQQPTVETFLRGVGLEDYAKLFTQNDITSIQLMMALTDDDLRSIGIVSLGHRKLLLGGFKEKSSPLFSSNTHILPESSAPVPEKLTGLHGR